MIRTGGGVFSITRICTVLVWLRKKQAVLVRSPSARVGDGNCRPTASVPERRVILSAVAR